MHNIFQIILSVMLVTVIILQAKGTGLGSAWGGSSQNFHTKRGFERILFYGTIALAIVFILSSLFSVI